MSRKKFKKNNYKLVSYNIYINLDVNTSVINYSFSVPYNTFGNYTKFVVDFQKLFPEQEFVNCDSMEDALINSDVIITATNSSTPVINYNYLKDQYLIIGMLEIVYFKSSYLL